MTTVLLDAEARQLLAGLPRHFRDGAAAVLVTVLHVEGSTPRGPGARMLVRGGRLLDGTIGGGRLEEQALEIAAEVAVAEVKTRRFVLGPELAQCCGGVVELLFEGLGAEQAQARAQALQEALRDRSALRTEAGDRVLIERPGALRTVLIFGAGHVGTALAQVLSTLPWQVIVVDPRPTWADPARFPESVRVLAQSPMQVLASWGWLGEQARSSLPAQGTGEAPRTQDCSAVVMTHDHSLDRDIVHALLAVGADGTLAELAYTGVIGSKTKIAVMRHRLVERGVHEAALQRLVAPIGLRVDEALLGGKLPGEIAISVAAQLLATGS